jgi:glycerophosphoryl diester phosphodiesterase
MFLTLLLLISTIVSSSKAQSNDDYASGEWRKNLDNCWTDPSCERVMTVAHGGEWNVTFPYDSLPAMETAFADGADCVKGGN